MSKIKSITYKNDKTGQKVRVSKPGKPKPPKGIKRSRFPSYA